jgi:hypothetical protein
MGIAFAEASRSGGSSIFRCIENSLLFSLLSGIVIDNDVRLETLRWRLR